MPLDFLRDCTLIGPALPEPFVRFDLEVELSKEELLPKSTGAEGRALQEAWSSYRNKIREVIRGGPIRVRNHIIEPLIERLGYARLEHSAAVETREGNEEGGDILVSSDGNRRLRAWSTEFNEDLEAPARRGAAYRYSRVRIAQRVLLASGERLGLLTNGTELRILVSDPARPDSQIVIHIDPAWKERRGSEIPDSYKLLLALASPKGVRAIPELVEKARLQQTRVTKELRRQAREAIEAFLQEVLDNPANNLKVQELKQRDGLARELWREALIVVYRLLFILKLEATDDPARSFSFASTSLWRNTFSPSVALPRHVRALLDGGVPTGQLLEEGVRGLFRMFVHGLDCAELHVRPLGGTLFGDGVTPLLSDVNLKWGERAVARLLDSLLWTTPKRSSQGRERVHYGSLDVEDLGRVYEALLELEPGIAAEPVCRLRRAKLEVVVPIAQGGKYRTASIADDVNNLGTVSEEEAEEAAENEEPEEPVRGRKTKVEWIEEIRPGQFFLRVGLGRKATGSYYTPHSFVRFLVQETLGSLVAERSPHNDPKPSEILKMKVLDPAMGSGHFLVEACRFLGNKLYEAARLCDERLAEYERRANAAQNADIRKQAEEDADEYRRRLDSFVPPDAELLGYLPSRSPEAGQSGLSQKRAEAICRRLVAIHCLYGVDKNPLAVELAKVSLWIESHSEGLPLTFLDHRLVVGDSITGPFFRHLLTYPASKQPVEDLYTQNLPEKFNAALEEALALVREIESTLGATIGDVEVKRSMRLRLDTALAPFKIVAAAWAGGVMLDPAECDDAGYRWLLSSVAEIGRLPDSLSEWPRLLKMVGRGLALETPPSDSLDLERILTTEAVTAALSYDLVFPEVFFPNANVKHKAGFDAVFGNPPWDAIRPNAKEFFASYDFEILSAPSKRERLAFERRLKVVSEVSDAWNSYSRFFEEQDRIYETLYSHQNAIIDGRKTGGDWEASRLFLEKNFQLLHDLGRTGLVAPSGFHVAEGATGIRKLYMESMRLLSCFSFQNKRKIFDIVTNVKFDLIVSIKGLATAAVECAFNLHNEDWVVPEFRDRPALRYTLDFIRRTGGKYLTLIELKSASDLAIAEACFASNITLGSLCARLSIRIGRELHMTDDAWRFTPTSVVLGGKDPRDGEILANITQRGFIVVAEEDSIHLYTDHWTSRPIYLVGLSNLNGRAAWIQSAQFYRLFFRRIATIVDARSFMAAIVPPGWLSASPQAHRADGLSATWIDLLLLALLNSFSVDWNLRLRITSTVNLFIADSVPLPQLSEEQERFLVHLALMLTCNHSGYAGLWSGQLSDNWRHSNQPYSWPVISSDAERWTLRAAIDAVVAAAFSLDMDQYRSLLSTFNHRSYPQAPALCTQEFEELNKIGAHAFVKKYDPYWDIPLNKEPAQPAIDFPVATDEGDNQAGLVFPEDRLPRRSREKAESRSQIDSEQYDAVREFLESRGLAASSDFETILGIDSATARILLKRLVADGLAEVQGRGRATRYIAKSSIGRPHAHPAGGID